MDIDEEGRPTSAPFRTKNMSVDVASLASLLETRMRFANRWTAITSCKWFIDEGHAPEHAPIPGYIAHAIVPRKLNQKKGRRIANLVTEMYEPLTP